MNDVIIEFFKQLPPEWMVITISAMPVTELRGAIPVGMMMGMAPLKVFLLAILGNLLPVLPTKSGWLLIKTARSLFEIMAGESQ